MHQLVVPLPLPLLVDQPKALLLDLLLGIPKLYLQLKDLRMDLHLELLHIYPHMLSLPPLLVLSRKEDQAYHGSWRYSKDHDNQAHAFMWIQ